MPRLKPFDKKTATTYALVYRPQNDPLIHDSDAPSQVFQEIQGSSRQEARRGTRAKRRGDLEAEFGLSLRIRDNEGEAAEHGVYFDDSSYDYMQHMRDLGGGGGKGGGEATWIEAPSPGGKGRSKQSLADALSEFSLRDDDDDTRSRSSASSHAGPWQSTSQPRKSYQTQQDVPDELAGFQPDMDPRLREVLEALDDEAYVDDDDDGIFEELAVNGGGEVPRDVWEDEAQFEDDDGDDDGWESDETEKPAREYISREPSQASEVVQQHTSDPPEEGTSSTTGDDHHDASIPAPAAEDQDFLASFARGRAAENRAAPRKVTRHAAIAADATSSAASTGPGRRRRRKGALTDPSSFSMTSSSLARTEPLSLLDARFDRVAESYMDDVPEGDDDDDGNVSLASGATGASRASAASRASSAWAGSQASAASMASSGAPPRLAPAAFDAVLDDFLGGMGGAGARSRRPMRKAGAQALWSRDAGLRQLDEIRRGLGPARVDGQNKAPQRV